MSKRPLDERKKSNKPSDPTSWTRTDDREAHRIFTQVPSVDHGPRLGKAGMKRRHMNSVARSLCDYLCSRNNDIAGYWGIGMLCAIAKRERKRKFSFRVVPGATLRIYSYEISDSQRVTEKLVMHGIDSIEGRLSFFEDGRFPHGAEKYTCGIAIAVTQGGRTGMSMSHVECWPHDPSRESRRATVVNSSASLLERIKKILN